MMPVIIIFIVSSGSDPDFESRQELRERPSPESFQDCPSFAIFGLHPLSACQENIEVG
jgi:hypothetical protein